MEYRIMSDNEDSKNKLSDNSGTEKKDTANLSSASNAKVSEPVHKASTTENKSSEAKKSAAAKASTAKVAANPATKSATNKVSANPSNKTATAALVIALLSIAASAGHYIWQQQQTNTQLLTLNQQNQQAIKQSQIELKNNLATEFSQQLQQQYQATQLSQQNAKQAYIDSKTQLEQLKTQVSHLTEQVNQRQPSDWLIHEAEYLVRIAARTMWLERDTTAAIGLLRDADDRLKELNQPKFLPVRALINEDIENLALMPTLQSQDAILTLMALNKQVENLTLAGVNLAESLDPQKEDLTLSDDINDWQANLAKTWHKFLNDFITVRRRTGMVEPLMAPEQQQHLKQNLSLKVQLVQWAASEQKAEVYQQTLVDIQQWLTEFFDMSLPVNKKFYQSIEQLKQQTIHYDYPSDLRSLAAIKRLLQDTKQTIKETVEQKSAPHNNAQTDKTEANYNEEASGGSL
ncbi:uroporphyrinogen-III C-methyltransferase [Colwellia ponticola]|nr:uroporphyrinogen-III C-methyltransferase [Colwellia ponticola]